ncbi:MAG: hypothetical protein LUE93_14835 [Bacteroides sp.]|nr:hypothetical protein [Bacteroides sp.]
MYDPLHQEMHYMNDNTVLKNNVVNQIFKDSKERMWVATSEELVLFPDTDRLDDYIAFTTEDGLASSSVCAMEEDTDGNLWISTNLGISCYVESERIFFNYDHSDGALYGNYMNNSVAKTADGTIYFGSLNGVCYFNPSDRPVHVILPPTVFTEFKIHGKNYSGEVAETSLPVSRGNISLNYDQDIFSVSFNVMDKSLQGLVEYAYQMEGLSDAWINLGKGNQVTFRNIPYRRYKLHVKARYKDQQWPENYSTLLITVHPPFWLTWWARTLYALFFILIVFLYCSLL